MAVINTNYKALFGQAALKGTERSLQTAMQQLSTGKRINSAKDDAAGMAISTRMTQQIRALNQSVRNAGDAVSLIQTVEGATNAITDMLQRMRELAIQAINDTNANDQRSYLDLEFQQLKKEIVRISDMTEWNGFPVLNGSAGERVGEKPVYKITSDAQFTSGLTYASGTASLMSGSTTASGSVTTSGSWAAAGNLAVVMSGATLGSASFTLLDGTSFDITSAASVGGTGVLTISKNTLSTMGYNFLSGDVTISRLNASAVAAAYSNETILQTVSRTFFALDQLQANDLFINGTVINATAAADDTVSYSNNTGSAIAKAAVINDQTAATGVSAVVNPAIMTGTAMTAGDAVTGTVTINGIVTARITTVEDNTRASRSAVVEAINAASSLTGVVAIDTGYDNQGIRLAAVDGRNIEVSFNTAEMASTFAARTGLKEGIQSGTISLESSVEGNIVLTTSTTGTIENSGFTHNLVFDNSVSPDYLKGDYSDNISRYTTGSRTLVSASTDVKPLTISDLMLNGVAIRASLDEDDEVSLDSGTSDRASSAIAISNAINAHYSSTGVRAEAAEAVTTGTSTTTTLAGSKTLFVNGVGIAVTFTAGETASVRRDNILDAINAQTPNTGVYARDTGSGGITLATRDGRNLSVWFNSSQNGDTVTAAEFGLAEAAGVVSGAGLTGSSAPTNTIYGSVTLIASKQFTVEPGFDGFNTDSNFIALGFEQGTFGGEVTSAEGKMTPPRTGRLAFQVGASEGQLITIDLADFGKGGPITSSITGDVDDPGTVTSVGSQTTTTMVSGSQTLYINGIEVSINFNNQGPTETASQAAATRRALVIDAINDLKVEHNVQASDNGTGITLTNLNGSNISVWFDSDLASAASEFGLGGADGVSGASGVTASYQGAKILYPDTNNIRSGAHATDVLSKLDKVMDRVNANRANMGAVMNRLQYAMDNLSNVSMNSSASRSQIEDADYAAASTELAKTQIMQQAATSVLAQANMSQQTVLKLLGG